MQGEIFYSENDVIKKNGLTKLVIDKQIDAIATNSDSKVDFKVRDIYMSRNLLNKGYALYRITDLSNTVGIEIYLKDGKNFNKVSLPTTMTEYIAQFVKEMHKKRSDYDCGAFVHAAFGLTSDKSRDRSKSVINMSDWELSSYSPNKITPGDAILIKNVSKKYKDIEHTNRHYAIYLGDGLFLSKFGTSGTLIACTIDEMKSGFDGNDVYKMTLK